MKKVFMFLGVALTALSFQSCRKGCYECTKAGNTHYLCEDDFKHYQKEQKAFNAAINLYQADGYKCKKD